VILLEEGFPVNVLNPIKAVLPPVLTPYASVLVVPE
jgi:adenosine/AMP kinase